MQGKTDCVPKGFRRIGTADPASLDSLAPPWEEGTAETVYDGRIFVVEKLPAMSPTTGEIHSFTRLRAREWVTVVTFLPGGDLVLVVQRRHGAAKAFIEFPAGLADDGEDPAAAALRELREETGLAPGRLEYLGAVYPSPAFLTNRCHFFRAVECFPVSEDLCLDDNEELMPVVMSGSDFEKALESGQVDNSMCLCGWVLHQSRGRTGAGS